MKGKVNKLLRIAGSTQGIVAKITAFDELARRQSQTNNLRVPEDVKYSAEKEKKEHEIELKRFAAARRQRRNAK